MSILGKKELIEAYLKLRPVLIRFLVARFRDDAIAEDIVQEIYFKLDRLSGELNIENIDAYLFKIANNLALDFRKSVLRRHKRELTWNELSTHTIKGEPVHDQPNALESINGQQKFAKLEQLIEELPPQCKRVFIAHKIQGASHKEIAEKLNISRSAIEKHMARALKYLATNIDRD